jgi:predicted MFS family arabinose efflux permease
MNKMKLPLLWGWLHGLNDFSAGFMLAHFAITHESSNSFSFLVLYAIIGFGGQLPVGFWLDHSKNIRAFSIVSIILIPAAALLYLAAPAAGILLAGFAAAFVHVTGGAVCLQAAQHRSAPLGWFTAPGVLGLTLGGLLAGYGVWQLIIVAIMVLPTGWLILRSAAPDYPTVIKKAPGLDTHDKLMLLILLFMCFRSFVFDIINQFGHHYEQGILIIGISAFAGKIIGGYMADAIGWKKFVYLMLALAFLLFTFGKENIYALAFGIACLQSSVPLTLMLMGRALPLYPATASAFSLGTAIALAGLPYFLLNDHGLLLHPMQPIWPMIGICSLLFVSGFLLVKWAQKALH